MKFGNASWGFRELPLEKQLEITKDMGLSVLELGIANAPMDLHLDGDINTVKNLYSKYGIELICAATGNDFTTGNRDDIPKIKKVIDMCAKLQIQFLRIFAGFSPVHEVIGKRWENMIFCLTECAEYAKKEGVTLTIETHGGVSAFHDGVTHFYSTSSKPEILYKMLSEIPQNVMVNFDPANLWAVGEKNPEKVLEKIKDKVAVVHLKDFVSLESGHLLPSACGESDMDWSKIMIALKDFKGPMLFEYEIPETIEEGSKKCYKYIKNILERIRENE